MTALKPYNLCEGCNDGIAESTTTMPLAFGTFIGNLCLQCAMRIHEDKNMLIKIVKKRAENKGYTLPLNRGQFAEVLSWNRRAKE